MIETTIRYVHYDPDTFKVLGFYSSSFPKNIKEPNAVITMENIEQYNANQNTHVKLLNGSFDSFHTIEEVLTASEKKEITISKRKQAYREESDPLFLEWQYDGTAEAEQVWRDKVSEIKLRYSI